MRHIDLSPRGLKPWVDEFASAQGQACGIHFKAAAHLAKHKQYAWQKPYLRDLPSRPWTVFQAGSRRPSL